MTDSPAKPTRRASAFPFFLILLGVYPILFLHNQNLGQTPLAAASLSTLLAVGFSLLLSGLCLWTVRPRSRAYLLALLLNLAFFTYGHLFNLVDAREIGGFRVGRHMVFLPVFAAAAGLLALLILKRPAPRERTVRTFANVLLGGLCLFQLAGILSYTLSIRASDRAKAASPVPLAQPAQADGPDIYYIILDGFLREDALRERFPDLSYTLPADLAARGFYVPRCAFSNYGATSKSLASSLNMNYLDALGVADVLVNNDENEPDVLYPLLHGNQVALRLREQGYQFVAFRGFFPLNDFQQADHYFSLAKSEQGQDTLAERGFREMFIRTTLLRLPSELYEGSPQRFSFVPKFLAELIAPEASPFSSRSYRWYQEHMFAFDQLEKVPEIPGRKFVYAHLYTTHQPFVLRADGGFLWPVNEDNAGYRAAVEYTSRRILEVVDTILANSAQPPVIVIQADHGSGQGLDLYKILSAYYLPSGAEELYDTITPVNTFRVILNRYAGGQYDLLPDQMMTSQPGKQEFVPVPASCDPAE